MSTLRLSIVALFLVALTAILVSACASEINPTPPEKEGPTGALPTVAPTAAPATATQEQIPPTPAPTPTVEPTSPASTPVASTTTPVPVTRRPIPRDTATPRAPVSISAPTSTPTPQPTTPSPTPESSTPVPTSEPTPDPLVEVFSGVSGILDPTNFDWPREVEGLNGLVKIPSKPERVIGASIGHDEVILALVPVERLAAVGSFTKNATYSNIHHLIQDKPEITRDPETIIAQDPDLLVTSPFFAAEGIEALTRVGIPVVQTELKHDAEARINNILLTGYMLGEEERAIEFVAEVRERYDSLIAVTMPAEPKVRVLALTQYSDSLWTAGSNSTEGGVISAAGGINAAAEAGIEGNQITSLEGVISMDPELIIIPQPLEFGAAEFKRSLLENEALSNVPAVKNERIYVVEGKHFTTLSYWNIRGAEELARLLWPDAFSEAPSPTFSVAE